MPKQVNFAAFWQDAGASDEQLDGGTDWVTSLSANWKTGPWEIRGNLIAGDNGGSGDRSGFFWGAVVTPSIWIVPGKLDFVVRYQYAEAQEDEGIQLWSRYARRAQSMGLASVNNGRGDQHHNIYMGLSHYLCEDNLKIMAGIEYDDISSGGRDVYEGWTSYLAVRTYF